MVFVYVPVVTKDREMMRPSQIVLVLVLIGYLSVPAFAGWPTVGIYDENVIATNTVDYVAAGSSLSDKRFASRVRNAFENDFGGVISSVGIYLFDYGKNFSKSLDMRNTYSPGTIPSGYLPNAISGPNSFATTSLGDPPASFKYISFDFVDLLGATGGEELVEFGVTVLSLDYNYDMVTGKGRLHSGGTMVASRIINEADYLGDTFFGFTAPPGDHFTGFSLQHDLPTLRKFRFDDIGFRTAVVGQERLEVTPAVDVQVETTTAGAMWNMTDSASLLVADRHDSNDTEKRGIIEFDISEIQPGATIQSAMLEFDVGMYTSDGPWLDFYGYSGDGLAGFDDINQLGSLVATSREIDDLGQMTVSLDMAFLESIAGADYLGLVMRQGNDGSQAGITPSEGSYLVLPPTLTIDFTNAIPEPSTLAGLVSLVLAGLVILWRNRRR